MAGNSSPPGALAVARDLRLSPTALRLYLMLDTIGAGRWCLISQRTVAGSLGLTARAVRPALHALDRYGYIERRRLQGGTRARFAYRVRDSGAQKNAGGEVAHPPRPQSCIAQ